MDFNLRPWNINDLDSLVKYANNPKIAANLTDAFPFPYTKNDGLRFIEMATSKDPDFVMAIIVDGEAVGGIGIHPKNEIERLNAELGYWIGEAFWDNKIISRAIPLMVKYGFSNFGIKRIYAIPYPHNIASIKALEKSGFILEAKIKDTLIKNDVVMDKLIYAIRKDSNETLTTK